LRRLDRVIGVTHEIDFIASAHRLPDGVASVQGHIGQDGEMRPPCGVLGGRKQLTLFHIHGFEPLAEYRFIHRIFSTTLVANLVEAARCRTLNPGGCGLSGPRDMRVFQGISTPRPWQNHRIWVGQGLAMSKPARERLHARSCKVNAQWTELVFFLGYIVGVGVRVCIRDV